MEENWEGSRELALPVMRMRRAFALLCFAWVGPLVASGY